jgi:hypothetical protein
MNLDPKRASGSQSKHVPAALKSMVQLRFGDWRNFSRFPGLVPRHRNSSLRSRVGWPAAGSSCMDKGFFVSRNSQLRRSLTKYVVASHSNLAIKIVLIDE